MFEEVRGTFVLRLGHFNCLSDVDALKVQDAGLQVGPDALAQFRSTCPAFGADEDKNHERRRRHDPPQEVCAGME